jgi:lipopolysaccharide export LptBFGC system permease protein LptF
MVEETEYQQFFQKALDKAGKSIPSMSDDEKKAFFDKIDATWDGKGEKNEALVGGQKKLDVDGDGDEEDTKEVVRLLLLA